MQPLLRTQGFAWVGAVSFRCQMRVQGDVVCPEFLGEKAAVSRPCRSSSGTTSSCAAEGSGGVCPGCGA
eukprot:16433019-Heterocapsa_arctica.AAC.1